MERGCVPMRQVQSGGAEIRRFTLLACWLLMCCAVAAGVLAGRWEQGMPGR